MAKSRKSRVSKNYDLPKKEQVFEGLKALTGQEAKEEQEVKRGKGRPIKLTAKGRAKFTTMLQPDLIERLKIEAAKRRLTVADVLEEIVTSYYGK